ncbi:MAG: hypothetical protein AAGU27_15120 [Dehalobacterium sp.]
MGSKSCLNCIHGSKAINENAFYLDNTVKPYRIVCAQRESVADIGKKYNWNELTMPEVCGQYIPIIIKYCSYCKRPINVAEYLWELWAGTNGKPVCSSDCRVKLEAAEIGNFFYD